MGLLGSVPDMLLVLCSATVVFVRQAVLPLLLQCLVQSRGSGRMAVPAVVTAAPGAENGTNLHSAATGACCHRKQERA